MMSLGVVIPTYDGVTDVNRLLRSLASGERLPDEIVIVDNAPVPSDSHLYAGSPCKTQIVSLGAEYNVSAARNAGAAAVTTDIVLFVDDDNLADPGLCSSLVKLFEHNSEIYAAGPLMRSLSTGKIWCAGVRRLALTGQTIYIGYGADDWDETWSRNTTELPNCFAVRRDIFNSIGGFDSRLFPINFEEADLAARLKKQYGSGFLVEPSAVIYHDVAEHMTVGSVLLRSLHHGGHERVRTLSRSRILYFGIHRHSRMRALVLLGSVPVWAALVSADGMRQPATWRERACAVGQLWVGVVQGYSRLLTIWAAHSRTRWLPG